jgi:hypothetical protein
MGDKSKKKKKKSGVNKRGVNLAMDSAWSVEGRTRKNRYEKPPPIKKHKTMSEL